MGAYNCGLTHRWIPFGDNVYSRSDDTEKNIEKNIKTVK